MNKEFDFKKPKTHVVLTDSYISFIRGNNDLTIHKSLRGETKLFYSKIVEIKYKKPTFTSEGYIQFCT